MAEAKFLTLKSSDGKEFSLSESAAALSEVFKRMMEDSVTEGEIFLENVDGEVLEKVIEYLKKRVDGGVSEEEKKKFDAEFVAAGEMKVLFDVVNAANFLEIKSLLDAGCREIAKRIKDKSVKWVRKTLNIENDFDAEEEELIKVEYEWAWEGVEPDSDDD